MEPVRFADILFIVLALAVTFGILALVNRKRTEKKSGESLNSAGEPGNPEESRENSEQQS